MTSEGSVSVGSIDKRQQGTPLRCLRVTNNDERTEVKPLSSASLSVPSPIRIIQDYMYSLNPVPYIALLMIRVDFHRPRHVISFFSQ